MRSRLVVLSAVLMCVLAGSLLTAGRASAASVGFSIYNFSGETFRLAEIRGEDASKQPVFEIPADAPKVGDLLAPGSMLDVELLYETGCGQRGEIALQEGGGQGTPD
jgi:hypothetical protein